VKITNDEAPPYAIFTSLLLGPNVLSALFSDTFN